MELAGKVAIVTGGASGIGRAIAERLADEGARVVIGDLNAERGEALAASLGESGAFCRTDVTDAASLDALVAFAADKFGPLDVMVNNAGIPSVPCERLLDDELVDFHQVMSVNLFGVMAGTRAAGRLMREQGTGGVIINTASSSGVQPGMALMTYRASKAAVAHFTRCAALDLAEYGIRVNAVAPGMTKTEMMTFAEPGMSAEQAAALDEAMLPVWLAGQPLKLQCLPQDVANSVAFLASDRARLITGVVSSIDGGMTVGDPVNHLRALMERRSEALGG